MGSHGILDYYRVLGVPRDATTAQIRRAYRKGALKHHPDKNDGDSAAEAKFKEIGEAYEVLSDARKRQIHDAGGDATQFEHDWGAAMDPHDLFSHFFAGGCRRPPGAYPQAPARYDELLGGTEVLVKGHSERTLNGVDGTVHSCRAAAGLPHTLYTIAVDTGEEDWYAQPSIDHRGGSNRNPA